MGYRVPLFDPAMRGRGRGKQDWKLAFAASCLYKLAEGIFLEEIMKQVSAVFFVVAALLASFPASADEERDPFEGGGFGYFLTGWQRVFIGELKTAVAEAGYPPISDNFATFGGGGHFVVRDFFIVGGEGGGLVSGETNQGNYRVAVSGGYGFFDIGAQVYRRGEFRVYPMFGFGGGGISISITDNRGTSFSDALRNPARSTVLSTGSFLLQGAVGLDYLLNFSHEPEHAGGILVGLRAGYIVNPLGNYMGWDSDGAPLASAPADVFHGPYVRLVIGGGGHGPADGHECRHHGDRRPIPRDLPPIPAPEAPAPVKKQADPNEKDEPKPADKK